MTLRTVLLALAVAGVSAACATVPAPPAVAPQTTPVAAAVSLEPALRLVESWPLETTLDHPDIADAKDVWPALFARASQSLDVAQFYAESQAGSALERSIEAMEAAAARGVQVRFLADDKFAKTYPQTLARLAAKPNVQVRRYAMEPLTGGVLHAKYFVVDGTVAYLGSQNFDWRSLEHIQEVGLTVEVAPVVRALEDVFETDWAIAGGGPKEARVRALAGTPFPVTVEVAARPLTLTPVFSPKGWLPDESLWDLPKLVALIDSAKKSVRVQVLTYRAGARKGERFDELEDALKRAKARGVEVRLLVSHWALRKGTVEGLRALDAPPLLTVKVETIPPFSGGDIPFARVVHAKYLVVDGERAWVGTGNWERGYFYESRNVGLIVEGASFAGRLARFFDDGWDGPYTSKLSNTFSTPAGGS